MNCRNCRKPIPASRLAAVPDATLCVTCLEAEGDVDIYQGFLEVQGKSLYEFRPVRGVAKLAHIRLRGIGSTRPQAPVFKPIAGKDFKPRKIADDGSKRGSGAEPGAIYHSTLNEKHCVKR